ncbi:hypothetical protein B0T24DRAFT_600281 [Lasiosphaeria ovina]|uniref:Uncharacterized protein n=1 Tax=Lasiosphaeria ovina TaxID=92902 RepID=A0AAE0JRC7_9PEZI|nr:hypothetical protein B0T24DRAFT_600281 [Lasiosphaeria ovina]
MAARIRLAVAAAAATAAAATHGDVPGIDAPLPHRLTEKNVARLDVLNDHVWRRKYHHGNDNKSSGYIFDDDSDSVIHSDWDWDRHTMDPDRTTVISITVYPILGLLFWKPMHGNLHQGTYQAAYYGAILVNARERALAEARARGSAPAAALDKADAETAVLTCVTNGQIAEVYRHHRSPDGRYHQTLVARESLVSHPNRGRELIRNAQDFARSKSYELARLMGGELPLAAKERPQPRGPPPLARSATTGSLEAATNGGMASVPEAAGQPSSGTDMDGPETSTAPDEAARSLGSGNGFPAMQSWCSSGGDVATAISTTGGMRIGKILRRDLLQLREEYLGTLGFVLFRVGPYRDQPIFRQFLRAMVDMLMEAIWSYLVTNRL